MSKGLSGEVLEPNHRKKTCPQAGEVWEGEIGGSGYIVEEKCGTRISGISVIRCPPAVVGTGKKGGSG